MLVAAGGDSGSKAGQAGVRKGPSMAPRRQYSLELKLRVVKETLAPGASVSIVARRHNINSNVVFRWRKEYREGNLGENTAGAFVPVRVVRDAPAVPAISVPRVPLPEPVLREGEAAAPARCKNGGIMELALPGGFSLRLDADVDERALRRVLKAMKDLA